MVLAERNTTELARNGRRSRGPSPNTHAGGGGTVNVNSTGGGASSGASSVGGNSTNVTANEKASNVTTTVPGAGTPESSDDDNSTKRNGKSKAKQSEYEEKIRVGRDYQAVCPPLIPEVERRPELMNERALLVWSPTKEIPDMKLEEYISVAKEKYGYNGEQALGMLFWHKHDLERAVMDLANFTPFPDEWTMEDKVLFEQAFQFHGKSFHRIRQMLPDKSIASLVKYYYSWKKTRHRSSAMDRQEKPIKTAVKDGSENGSEVGSNEESDNDDKKVPNSNNNHINTNTTTTNNNNNAVPGLLPVNHNNEANLTAASTIINNNNNSHSYAADNDNNVMNNSNNHHVKKSNNVNDMDVDRLCIYSNANNDEMLGFGLPGSVGYPTTGEMAATTTTATNGDANGDANDGGQARVVVGGFCKNCNVVCYILFDSPLGRMCKSCHTHWSRTGIRRPISGPECIVPKRSTNNNAAAAAADRSKRKPPKGMYINHDDITALASCKNPSEYLAEGDRKIASLMADIQKNKQIMEQLEKDCEAINIEDAANAGKPGASPEIAQPRISARWTQDEIQMAILALRDYGKNYAMIAKVVLTKTEAHVRNFYLHNRRRLNLDQIVKEHEALMACKVDQVGGNGCGEEPADGSDVVLVDGTPAIKTSADESNNRSSQEQKKDEFLSKKTKEVTAAIKDTENDTVVSAVAVGSPTTIPTSSSATDANIAANSSPVIGKSSKLVVLTPSTTFTIVDESDTTTNSSSDAAISNSINNAPGTLSSLSSSSVSVAGKSSPSNRSSERDSEESFPIKSGVGGAKRDSSVLQNTEKSAAKKIAISSEFYEK
ncbi:REST corepressor isoform X2 [Scaptodrosophila lebanonensis]|uniref:REST corepressor isoform X2 n=1 Tax=Drosophila lebanonensis TaxID=7225 RepID=A0A6J2TXP9_DROLE|nr:REST corepressor isoform X2 [Scaptodrosophila lebanonensis]